MNNDILKAVWAASTKAWSSFNEILSQPCGTSVFASDPIGASISISILFLSGLWAADFP